MCRLNPCECEEDNPLIAAAAAAPAPAPSSIVLVLPSINDPVVQPVKDYESELHRWPTSAEVVEELKQMSGIAGPMVVMGLLLYARSMISMLFLGHLGKMELAGGALSMGFANITGYSVLAGLAMGMEPICGQACGAKRWHLMGITLQRTILVLLCVCVPIASLWINMQRILLWCGQDEGITAMAGTYILFSLPDLLAQAILNPLRIYLRTQNITTPLTWCSALALALHVPINLLLVIHLKMRIRGVALSAALTDFNLVIFLVGYLRISGKYKRTWDGWSRDSLKDWRPLLNLAIPSCISVCLEWWWYEFMIIVSGLLTNAKAAVASMGILIQTTALVYIFPSSLSLAVSTRVGNELGANRPAKARIAMMVALACAGVVAVLAMTFTTTMRHVWGGMFTKDDSILSLTSLVLPIVGLCELGNCPQTTGCGVLRGCARPSTGANINLGSFYFVGMPVAMALGFLFNVGFPGLWLGLLAAQGTCAALMMIVLMRTDWALQAERAKHLTCSVDAAPAAASSPRNDEEEMSCIMSSSNSGSTAAAATATATATITSSATSVLSAAATNNNSSSNSNVCKAVDHRHHETTFRVDEDEAAVISVKVMPLVESEREHGDKLPPLLPPPPPAAAPAATVAHHHHNHLRQPYHHQQHHYQQQHQQETTAAAAATAAAT
ncbi:protein DETOXIFICATION 48 [Selaginella moellendorffii]|uniref:protein DETOXIFICATION 48 n=1 Tax=Selaginella moellendorffii TaxID=88036 RepID=UPI000D1C2655|nr:protein DETOXIFICATION 48 [Selaginella moellendorffii]|eukprot:XP_002981285.2 protein DETOXIFICATION 48 [Selaginella moellendorffii]